MHMTPRYFATPADFRAWLRKNHTKTAELVVGFFKKASGRPSMTWPESVAEALCYGWIDGIRRRLDDDCYTIRFTPRRKGSNWSALNIRTVAELEAAGKMTDAGRAAFEARPDPKSKGYSYVKREGTLDIARLRTFKKNKAAWSYFQAQAPGYQGKAMWWVMSAQQDETRDKRLARLVAASATGKRLA